MQPAGKLTPGNLAKILLEGAITDPDVTATGCEGDALVINYGNGGAFHDLSFRQRNLLALVEVLHGGCSGGEGCCREH